MDIPASLSSLHALSRADPDLPEPAAAGEAAHDAAAWFLQADAGARISWPSPAAAGADAADVKSLAQRVLQPLLADAG